MVLLGAFSGHCEICEGSFVILLHQFLETELVYEPETVNNMTVTRLTYEITELRQDPDYIRSLQS